MSFWEGFDKKAAKLSTMENAIKSKPDTGIVNWARKSIKPVGKFLNGEAKPGKAIKNVAFGVRG